MEWPRSPLPAGRDTESSIMLSTHASESFSGYLGCTAKHKSLEIERDGGGQSACSDQGQAGKDLMASQDQAKSATHEAFSREENIVAGSDRSFGLVMAGAFAMVSLLNAWHVGRVWPWAAGLAALFLAAALFRPAI